ncbi:MAG: pirin family protein [Anaerolineae bacterium]|nr:pirin family protein [Anaerolineae bacterium]
MKTLLRSNQDRWHKQEPWKKSAYAFVPYRTHFGELCGFADDVVQGGHGFGLHPHQEMEISTIVVAGAQQHEDSTGSQHHVTENMVQTMSAGTGIQHSEVNASSTEPFHSYQIWVYPKVNSVSPRHATFTYQPADKLNRILLTLSPDGRNGTAIINQDAFFSVSRLQPGTMIDYTMYLPGNGVYLHCVSGEIAVAEHKLRSGDALGVYETGGPITITAVVDSELIFVEVPMTRGIQI